jgi:drug/metabolite transporter (DMT)-like permease
MKKSELIGHGLALFTALMWGTSFIATKLLLDQFNPLEILFIRFVLGYLALWMLYPYKLKIDSKQDRFFLFLTGLSGVTLYFLCENTALTYSFASNVGVLVSVAPFLTGLLSHFYSKEKMNKSFLLGFVISILGIGCISYNGATQLKLNPLGDVLAILAALLWALYSVFLQKANEKKAYPVIGITRKVFFYGILTMIPCLFFYKVRLGNLERFNLSRSLSLLYLGLICSAVCYITWNKAMSVLGTMKTSAYIYLVPLVTLLFSAIILKENITRIALIGTVLILFGLIMSERKEK